jgi:hypothetical protein
VLPLEKACGWNQTSAGKKAGFEKRLLFRCLRSGIDEYPSGIPLGKPPAHELWLFGHTIKGDHRGHIRGENLAGLHGFKRLGAIIGFIQLLYDILEFSDIDLAVKLISSAHRLTPIQLYFIQYPSAILDIVFEFIKLRFSIDDALATVYVRSDAGGFILFDANHLINLDDPACAILIHNAEFQRLGLIFALEFNDDVDAISYNLHDL